MKFSYPFLLANLCICIAFSSQHVQSAQSQSLEQHFGKQRLSTVTVNQQPTDIVHYPSQTDVSRGLVIFLSAAGGGSADHRQAQGAAIELANIGWASAAVAIPKLPNQNTTPVADSDGGSAGESDGNSADSNDTQANAPSVTEFITDDALQNHQQYMTRLLAELVALADQHPGFLLVVSEGITAAQLTKVFQQSQPLQPDGLVIVSPFLPQHALNQDIVNNIGRIQPPLLMVDVARQNTWAQKTAKPRLVALKRARKLHYRARTIAIARNNSLFNQQLAHVINNWTRSMNW